MITWRNTKEEDERFILQVTLFFFSISLIEINQKKNNFCWFLAVANLKSIQLFCLHIHRLVNVIALACDKL